MQFRRIFSFQGPHHPGLQELTEGIGFFNGRQQAQAATDLIFVHAVLRVKTRRENSDQTAQNASTSLGGYLGVEVRISRSRVSEIASTRWPSRPMTVVAMVSAFRIASSVASTVAAMRGFRCVSAR